MILDLGILIIQELGDNYNYATFTDRIKFYSENIELATIYNTEIDFTSKEKAIKYAIDKIKKGEIRKAIYTDIELDYNLDTKSDITKDFINEFSWLERPYIIETLQKAYISENLKKEYNDLNTEITCNDYFLKADNVNTYNVPSDYQEVGLFLQVLLKLGYTNILFISELGSDFRLFTKFIEFGGIINKIVHTLDNTCTGVIISLKNLTIYKCDTTALTIPIELTKSDLMLELHEYIEKLIQMGKYALQTIIYKSPELYRICYNYGLSHLQATLLLDSLYCTYKNKEKEN